jgi:hypothetical protein
MLLVGQRRDLWCRSRRFAPQQSCVVAEAELWFTPPIAKRNYRGRGLSLHDADCIGDALIAKQGRTAYFPRQSHARVG